ncbi:nitrite reductase large subunit NirB [Paenibacillus lemnae]|uniref:NAD(P)/FAD-dependent oxidoreductase n=1 Tax=Paenibacillus lemnae TaxID=1330551 RepID=A0A848M4K1_PAELE|nr:nitrite reductase large subunit NirB [Paenibacillus lemnae]NMO95847.1 NAD(P)/FAD-dependent oxidoreductase [Paenibacillus lemnae]
MNKEKLLIIGNGMAGVRCVEEILELDPLRFDITIVGAEPRPNYNRILLSKVLQGEQGHKDIVLNDWSWYQEHNINLLAGEQVSELNPENRQAITASGMVIPYDYLVLATGSAPFIPNIPGTEKEGVITFRTLDDCENMKRYALTYRKAVVIGGGLLGLEAARGLLHLGMEAAVIHNAPYIMNRQLDAQAAGMLQQELEGLGMTFLLDKHTARITGRNRVKELRFTDGSRLGVDVVVLAVGIRPRMELAERSGIRTSRGIVVDDYMRTSVPAIYAVGECAEHRGISYGLVAPLYEQAKILARTLCDSNPEPYTGSIPYSQLKISGIDVFSAGQITGPDTEVAVQHYDALSRTYKKVMQRHGRVAGAVLYGDTTESAALLSMVKTGAAAEQLLTRSSDHNEDQLGIRGMPLEEIICACNSVSKGQILSAVDEHRLQTVQEIKEKTRASGSCGGCRPQVSVLLQLAKDGKTNQAVKVKEGLKPVCSCTDKDHATLHSLISETVIHHEDIKSLTMHVLLQQLGWRTPDGCPVCRQAITFYLRMQDVDVQVLSPECLHAETEASAPWVTGIKVWLDPGLKKCEFYEQAQSLSSTCLARWIDVPLPDHLSAAITLLSGSSVSLLVHSIGISVSPAGWEVYAGGHSAHPVKESQLIGVAEEVEDVVELASAALQLYRQSAISGESIWQWVERRGVMEIRHHLLDESSRQALAIKLYRSCGRPAKANVNLEKMEGLCYGEA